MFRNKNIIDEFNPLKGYGIIYIMTCISSGKSYIGQAYGYMINGFPMKNGEKHWKTFGTIDLPMEDKFRMALEYLNKLKNQNTTVQV